jgi:hypothetical protein
MAIDTDYKTIGLREIRVIPTAYIYQVNVLVTEVASGNTTDTIISTTLTDNSLETILTNMILEINFNTFGLEAIFYYNALTSELTIAYDNQFTFQFSQVGLNLESFRNWFKILNISEDEMNNYANTPWNFLQLKNVWNGRELYVHCSVANTAPYNYLGHDGEFYDTPTKLYKWTSKSSIINIWFSFNTKTPVQLYWQPVQISFQLLATVLK